MRALVAFGPPHLVDLMPPTPDERRAENDRRVAADVAKHGCHVISVFDPAGEAPPFSYSVGIQVSARAPDALVIGVGHALGHALINVYCSKVRDGHRFEAGKLYGGFLEGFEIYIEPIEASSTSELLPRRGRNHQNSPRPKAEEYTLGCARFYKGAPFAVVQLIYPTTKGVWPWDDAAPASFKANQPLLGRARPDLPGR